MNSDGSSVLGHLWSPNYALQRSWTRQLRGVLAIKVPAADQDAFTPIRFLLGTWASAASGEPGTGTAQRSYAFVLGNKFIHERNQTTYPPQERNKAGEVHEHWSLIGYDKARKLLTFRQ